MDTFAQTQGARLKLPRLIAELVLATSAVPDVMRFVADEAGNVRGFDGVLVSVGSPPFVPSGKSYWEFGTGQDIADKAKDDISARTEKVPPEEQADATIIFVTPRHYDNPRMLLSGLERELASKGSWKQVRVFDGAILKGWLVKAPGVAARWARREMRLSGGCLKPG